MRKCKLYFSRKDSLFTIACIVFVLANLGAIGSTGRRRAKQAVCLSNLRQWGVIADTYTKNHDGYFWPSAPGTPGYWWIRYLEDRYKDWKKNRIWFCPEAETPIYDEHGNRLPTLNIFSAWGIYKVTGLGPNGMAGSYGLNGYVLTPRPLGGGATTYEGGVPVQYGWRTPYVAGGSNIPVFLDALRYGAWPIETQGPAANEFSAWGWNNTARFCINRHNGAVGCVFMDWSARKVGLKELWKLKWHRAFNTQGPWTKAGGVRPADWPEWIRDFKDY